MIRCLLLALSAFAQPSLEPLTLSVGGSETLEISGLVRAAVADGKVARVRPVGDRQLLVTGLSPGKTSLRVWSRRGEETGYALTVLARDLLGSTEVVKVTLEFIEVDGSAGARYGLRWPELIEASAGGTFRGGAEGLTASFVGNLSTAKGMIEQLMTEGLARIIANPLLYVRLGETVTFNSGGEFPVMTSSQQEGRVYPRIEWKPFGLFVKVTPQSGDGVRLRSDVEMEVVETDPSIQVQGIPAINRRRLTTKMESQDGETVILSGLVRRVAAEGKEGVPLLASIPLIGILFSRNHSTETKSEILMSMNLSLRTRAQHAEDWERARGRLQAP